MNTSKTKVMVRVSGISNPTVVVRNEKLKVVDKYIYRDMFYLSGKENANKDISRRIQLLEKRFRSG